MGNSSWVLISGASTGIGRATALRLAAKGHRVIAGVRTEKAAEAIRAAGDGLAKAPGFGHLEPVMLDVADSSSIATAFDQTRKLAGPDGLRALINNAGIVVPGPVEHVSLKEWRRQFDVNFFGMVEMTQAALPLLRQGVAALGAGVPRLLFVSSIGGRVSQPFIAPYTSSKFATTALGDSLRLELRRQGIGVTVIEPGAIATPIWEKGNTAGNELAIPDHPARQLYGTEIDGLIALSRNMASRAISAEKAAEIIVRSMEGKRARAHVLIGTDAHIMARMKKWLPDSVLEGILAREFGISGK